MRRSERLMAEKRVSVRLAAVGGKQVRAELEGVGDAGVKGFGRMSKEAELANARLAAFATRVKIAAAVAVAAAAAAGIAMIKSGLETIDAQANLAQSLGTTTRSIQVLAFAGDLAGVSMDEIATASKKLTLKLSDAAGGTGTAVDALKRLHLTATDLQALPLDERIVAIQDALAKFVPPAERAAVASALFGDKAALAFSRIDSATLRQASQDITDFGVAVSDQDADQIRMAGDAIDRLGLVWLGLTNQLTVAVAPALETVANALADATRKGGIFQTSIAFLGDHIGEIASVAGAFAAFFVGRFVVALGAAALGVSGFSWSLTVLKGALIRTGIGALIVGAGGTGLSVLQAGRGRGRVWRSPRFTVRSCQRSLGPDRAWRRCSGRQSQRKLVGDHRRGGRCDAGRAGGGCGLWQLFDRGVSRSLRRGQGDLGRAALGDR
jgi:hypothetical protein